MDVLVGRLNQRWIDLQPFGQGGAEAGGVGGRGVVGICFGGEEIRVAPHRLAVSPQCGFATSVLGNSLSHDDQRAKLETLARTAERVWG